MSNKVKKIFSYLFKNKKALLVFLFFIFLGTFFFSQQVIAQSIGDIGRVIISGGVSPVLSLFGAATQTWAETKVITFVIVLLSAILYLPLIIAGIFLQVATWFLSAVINPNLINISFTGLNNPLIKMGWTLTRDLANMGIVLILVVIGLATILRIESYQLKKTLPTLIIIALLINFTPVILGLVVDASNILMYSFLKYPLNSRCFLNLMTEQSESVGTAWSNLISNAEKENSIDFSPLAKSSVLIVFAYMAGAIYIIFAFLFLLRYVVIWMLVILSPLAFIFYILPATRGFFSAWWKQFINWCFIGVIAAFFLYLSNGLLTWADSSQSLYGHTDMINPSWKAPEIEKDEGLSGLLSDILPYFIVIGFLIMALLATLATSAKGASIAINFTKTGGKWIGKKAGRGAWDWVEEKTKFREGVGKVTSAIEKVPVARWFLPEPVKKYAEFRPAIDEAQKEAMDISTPRNLKHVFSRAATGKKAAGKILSVIAKNDANDIFIEGRKYFKAKDNEELLKNPKFRKIMQRVIMLARNAGYHNKILRSDPRLAKLLAGETWIGEYANMNEQQAVARSLNEARDQHIGNMEPEVFDDPDFVEAALALFDRDRWLLVNRKIKRGQEFAQRGINKLFTNFVKTKGLPHKTTKDIEKAREEFYGDIKKRYKKYGYEQTEGYSKALGDNRIKQTGWEDPTFTEKEEEEEKEATGPTPGAAAGVPPPRTRTATRPTPGPSPRTRRGPGAQPQKKASVPVMITIKMKKALKDAGYSDEDIKKMTPEEA